MNNLKPKLNQFQNYKTQHIEYNRVHYSTLLRLFLFLPGILFGQI